MTILAKKKPDAYIIKESKKEFLEKAVSARKMDAVKAAAVKFEKACLKQAK